MTKSILNVCQSAIFKVYFEYDLEWRDILQLFVYSLEPVMMLMMNSCDFNFILLLQMYLNVEVPKWSCCQRLCINKPLMIYNSATLFYQQTSIYVCQIGILAISKCLCNKTTCCCHIMGLGVFVRISDSFKFFFCPTEWHMPLRF